MPNQDQFTPEQEFEILRQESILPQASKEQLVQLYLELLKLHYRHLNFVKTMFSEKLQGERSGRAV